MIVVAAAFIKAKIFHLNLLFKTENVNSTADYKMSQDKVLRPDEHICIYELKNNQEANKIQNKSYPKPWVHHSKYEQCIGITSHFSFAFHLQYFHEECLTP